MCVSQWLKCHLHLFSNHQSPKNSLCGILLQHFKCLKLMVNVILVKLGKIHTIILNLNLCLKLVLGI